MADIPPIGNCAYCGVRRAIHADHVVPASLLRKRPDVPARLRILVAACGECNWRKMTRRLVPPSLAYLVPELNEAFPGTPWRVWRGSVDEPAFREVWP
ncbi:MAG TPA: hypothetical protein VNP04_11375 [Alphaproteobacteria bacterium]|nr:hypothetical protein [Alphaproteobacteria bacterium]